MRKRFDIGQEVVGLQVIRRRENDAGGFEHSDVPFAPVAIGADVEKGNVRVTVIVLAQRPDERLELLEKDRIVPGLGNDLLAGGGGPIRHRQRNSARIKDPFRGDVVPQPRADAHHAEGGLLAVAFELVDEAINLFPVELPFLRLQDGPSPAGVADADVVFGVFVGAVVLHPAFARIEQHGVVALGMDDDSVSGDGNPLRTVETNGWFVSGKGWSGQQANGEGAEKCFCHGYSLFV